MKKILSMINIEVMGGAFSVTMYGIINKSLPSGDHWEWYYIKPRWTLNR